MSGQVCGLSPVNVNCLDCRAAADRTTSHIAVMVARQRDNSDGYNKQTWRVANNNVYQQHRAMRQHDGKTSPRPGLKVVMPDALKTKLKVLVARHGPVRVNEMISKYRATFLSNLYPLDYGAASVTELLLAIPDLFEVILKSGHMVVRTRESSNARREKFDQPPAAEAEAPARAEDETLKTEDRMKVTRVETPEEFYVQNSECLQTVQMLSNRLEASLMGAKPYLTHLTEVEGKSLSRNFAAKVQSIWVRVSVLELIDGDTVSIILNDYNIVKSRFPISQLYELPSHLEFDIIPKTIIKVSLAGVTKPANWTDWDKETLRKMKKTIIEWQVEATDGALASKMDLNSSQESLKLWLYDDKGNCLNDIMKEEILKVSSKTGERDFSVRIIGRGMGEEFEDLPIEKTKRTEQSENLSSEETERKERKVELCPEDTKKSDQIELIDAEDFLACSSPKKMRNTTELLETQTEAANRDIAPDDDEDTLTEDSTETKSSVTKNSEENHKTSQETVSSVQDIVFDQSQLIIVQAKDELWCHAGQIAQIIQHSVEEVTAVLRQNKVRVINGAIFSLRHLRTILIELDVEADIISKITSQL